MSADTCRLPGCDQPPGYEDDDDPYRSARFCCIFHEVKYDHLKADAQDARIERAPEPEVEPDTDLGLGRGP
jgi:hypothetical protein